MNPWTETASRVLRVLCCSALVMLQLSCASVPEPPLRIGTNSWPGYEPLYLARELGLYEDDLLRLVELPSSSEVIHALRSGTLEGATLTLDEALTLIEDGLDLRVILVMDFSHGGDVLVAKPEIKSLETLRGKRVAVEYTAVGAIVLDAALEEAGLAATDIEIVSCAHDEHLSCYESVDAVVTFEPVRTRLLKLGARQLFDSSRIPGRIVDVLVVLKTTLDAHPNALSELLNGYFAARHHLATEPYSAAATMAPRLRLSPDELLASYGGLKLPSLAENRLLLDPGPASLEATAADLVQFMVERDLLREEFSTDGLVDARFLPADAP